MRPLRSVTTTTRSSRFLVCSHKQRSHCVAKLPFPGAMRILYVPFEIRDEPKLKACHSKVDTLGVYCSGYDEKATGELLKKAKCIEYGR